MKDLTIIVRYSEIGLKGGNRHMFENALLAHIRKVTKKLELRPVKIRGRMLIETDAARAAEVMPRLGRLPGIHSLSLGHSCKADMDSLKHLCRKLFLEMWGGERPVRFRVSAQRSDKCFELKSFEINAAIGADLITTWGADKLKVDLGSPEIDLQLEIHSERAIVFAGRTMGVGGLPVGTAGQVLCLLSGGIDSPVAAYQMIRRGCRTHFIFFENRSFLGRAAGLKVKRLAEALSKFQYESRLDIVPFTDIQVAIRDNCREKNRVVLYRRMMYRIAERLARQHKLLGLVTGENLGQVASQTLENLQAVDSVSSLCVYRPLISLDKQDIMSMARKIGTYDISIEEAPDCCAVFLPSRPAIRAKPHELEEDEARLDMEALMDQALANRESSIIDGEA